MQQYFILPFKIELDFATKFSISCRNTSLFFGRLPLIYIIDEYRQCVSSLKKYLSIIQTDKHITEEFKILRIKFFINRYVELTNDFSLTTKMLRIKVWL